VPADITTTNDVGNCSAVVSVPPPTGTNDNCGILSVINSFNGSADASDTYPVGTNAVIWTITDIHGNSTTCPQTVTVNDVKRRRSLVPATFITTNDVVRAAGR